MPFKRVKAFRQDADHLAPAGVPERQRIEDRAGAERRNERVDACHLHQKTVEEAGDSTECKHDDDCDRPRHAEHGLQADRKNVPEHDAVADRKIDAAGSHRDHGRQRQESDDRLVGDDRAEIENRRKGLRQEQRKQHDKQQRKDNQAVNRQEPQELLRIAEARQFGSGRLKGGGFDRLHVSSPGTQAASEADAAAITADVVKSVTLQFTYNPSA